MRAGGVCGVRVVLSLALARGGVCVSVFLGVGTLIAVRKRAQGGCLGLIWLHVWRTKGDYTDETFGHTHPCIIVPCTLPPAVVHLCPGIFFVRLWLLSWPLSAQQGAPALVLTHIYYIYSYVYVCGPPSRLVCSGRVVCSAQLRCVEPPN